MERNNPEAEDADASTETKTERRARWEAFEFRVPAEGAVRVENTSYGEESGEHTYVVTVTDGERAEKCTCPADKYHTGPCKHRVAVEQQSAVLLAASADDNERGRVLADGGEVSR